MWYCCQIVLIKIKYKLQTNILFPLVTWSHYFRIHFNRKASDFNLYDKHPCYVYYTSNFFHFSTLNTSCFILFISSLLWWVTERERSVRKNMKNKENLAWNSRYFSVGNIKILKVAAANFSHHVFIINLIDVEIKIHFYQETWSWAGSTEGEGVTSASTTKTSPARTSLISTKSLSRIL